MPNIPLRVRSVGRNDVIRGWSEPPVRKWFTELTWTVSGHGEVLAGGEYLKLGPGEIFVYRPGDTHHLRALSQRWLYYWITFDHPDSAKWFEGFGLGTHKAVGAPCPEQAFMQVLEDLRSITAEGEKRAATRAHGILLDASSTLTTPLENTLSASAKRLMDEHFRNPDYNVTKIATQLGVHRSTLFRHFSAVYNLKPSTYLLNIRLHHGLQLLQSTTLPIQEVALSVGFTDANYFSRAIREATGHSPRSFRTKTPPAG